MRGDFSRSAEKLRLCEVTECSIPIPPLSWAEKSRRLSRHFFDEAFLFQLGEKVDHLLLAG